MGNDRGSVILGFFTKVVLAIGVFGLVAFDAVSVAAARVSIEDTAQGAAYAGAQAWDDTRNATMAYRAAVDFAEDHGARVDRKAFSVTRDGTVSVTLRKEATTILLFRTKKTLEWTKVSAGAARRAV